MLTEDGKHLYVSYDEYHNLDYREARAQGVSVRMGV